MGDGRGIRRGPPLSQEARDRRDAAIVVDRKNGLTLKEIGDRHMLSGERVREVLARDERRVAWTVERQRMIDEAATVEDIPLAALNLSMRACNGLYSLGCRTVGDTMKLGDGQLEKVWNLGRLSCREIRQKLYDLGCGEAPEVPPRPFRREVLALLKQIQSNGTRIRLDTRTAVAAMIGRLEAK